MAAVVPDRKRIKPFASAKALEARMRANHAKAPELWLKIHVLARGETIVPQTAPKGRKARMAPV